MTDFETIIRGLLGDVEIRRCPLIDDEVESFIDGCVTTFISLMRDGTISIGRLNSNTGREFYDIDDMTWTKVLVREWGTDQVPSFRLRG